MKFDCNEMPTIGVLSQVMHLCGQQAKLLFEQYDLKPGHAGILFVLHHDGEMSQRELAKKLNLTPPSITSAIQQMEKLEYIRREADQKDLRVMRLSITEKGSSYVKHIFEVGQQMDERVFRGMSVEEKLLLKRLLIQIRDNLIEGKDPSVLRPPM